MGERNYLRFVLNELIDKALASGKGFAIDRDGKIQEEVMSSGYAVAISDDHLTMENRRELIEDRIDWLFGSYHGHRIAGLWIDTKENKAYFDKGMNIHSKLIAFETAVYWKQKAVWDYAQKKEIYLDDVFNQKKNIGDSGQDS